MPPKGDMGGIEFADSGEDEGEGSVISGESNVELVVVGDDSVEAVVMDVTLPRWCKDCLVPSKGADTGVASVTRI